MTLAGQVNAGSTCLYASVQGTVRGLPGVATFWGEGNPLVHEFLYDKDGNLVGHGDIKAQTRRIFENMRKIVEAGGGKMDDIVKITVFVTDVRSREPYAEVRSEFFGANPPASTLVQIANLAIPGALIEIEAIAALD